MTKEKITYYMAMSGLCIVAAGAFLPIVLGPASMATKIVFTAGVAILLIGRLFSPYKGKVFRVKRLFAIEKWSAIAFAVAAYFLWTSSDPHDWIVFLLAGAFIQLYTSLAIPRAQRKAEQSEN